MNTIRLRVAAAIVASLLLGPGPALAELALDPAFGTNGLAGVNFAAGVDSARDVAVQADGRAVLVGLSRQSPGGTVYSYVGVARLLANGLPDPDFGSAGQVSLLPGGTPAAALNGGDARAVLVQPDQKILVAGAWNAGDATGGQIFVLRLEANGALDAGFGSGGVVLLTLPGLADPVADGLALQSDGSIIALGSGDAVAGLAGFVLRLTGAGGLDATFASGGILTIPNPDPNGLEFGLRDVAVLAGDALIVGGGGSDLYLARLTAAGEFDAAFASAGQLVVDLETLASGTAPSTDDSFGLVVQSTGRIVLAGVRTQADGERSTAVLVRILPDGSVDAGFGTNGVLDIPAPGAFAAAFDVVALANDDLVTAGSGLPFVQVSRNGRAQSPLVVLGTGDFVVGLQRAAGDRVLAAGSRSAGFNDSEFLAVGLTSSPLDDVADTTPDPFFFIDVVDPVAPGSVQTSNTVTITGINSPAPVEVEEGLYCIGSSEFCLDQNASGRFVTTPGVIQDGQSVTVRHFALPAGGSQTNTRLTIGGVSDTFTSTTAAGTVEPFDLGSRTNVPLWTFQTSSIITVRGIGAAAGPFAISVAGGEGVGYSVGCTGNFTANAGTVANNATVCVRHVSSTAGNTAVESTLVIGGTAGTFRSTTLNVDSTPDAFDFPPLIDAPIASVVQSAAVTVSGIGAGVQSLVRISGGEYSIGCTGTFTVGLGQISNGQSICVRHQSAGSSQGQVTTTLLIADVFGSFTSTTVAADLLPDRFEFASQSGLDLLVPVTSAPAAITGITGPAEVSVSGTAGSEVSIGCTGTFTATPGRIDNGQTLCVRHTSSGASEGTVASEVRVGGRLATFSSTTIAADLVPDPLTFVPVTGTGLRQLVTSAPVTITGINGPASIAASPGSAYSVGCVEPYTTATGTVRSGQTVCLQTFAGSEDGEMVTAVLAVGEPGFPPGAFVTANFDVTTGDTTPDGFVFVNIVGVRQLVRVTSDAVTISGLSAPALITIGGDLSSEYSLGCNTPYTRADGVVTNGTRVCVRHNSATTLITPVVSELTVGGRWACLDGTLTQIEGRAVCVNALGVPIVGARQRLGDAVGSTFTSTTGTNTVPGSSAVDPWTLGLLAPLLWWRRRASGAR
jgi:uncharacterized delta-60 repeat protein